MSLWSKITRLLPRRAGGNRPVGHDLQGNAYFEHANPYGRAKRMVEYHDESKIDYRKGTAQLPVQWTAWLSYTRDTPPSLAELQKDADRLNRLGPLVAAIEARERAERIQQGYLLPDGTEVSKDQVQGVQSPEALLQQQQAIPYPLDAEPQAAEAAPSDSDFIARPREKVDAASNNSADELRRLAEEDTKRRLKESGIVEGGAAEGVEGVGRAFKPRRRGAAA